MILKEIMILACEKHGYNDLKKDLVRWDWVFTPGYCCEHVTKVRRKVKR